ncbi:MAG: NYN domain-containing protein [Veillonellaceae bacterium]|nr:NYN domain-containing protein [Veillonellaceae bacterium]
MGKDKEALLVDGYNVINAWPELMVLNDLEHSRDKLIDIMANYGSYHGYNVLIVFDAHGVSGAVTEQHIYNDVNVVFTGEGETADSYIERTAYNLVRQGERVYVVTSDWAEQLVILGAGAFRIPARELICDVKRVNKLVQERFAESALKSRRHELGNRLNSEVAKRLDDLRRGR